MKRTYAFPIVVVLAILIAPVGCHRRTPEERAENAVRRLASELKLDAAQTEKLEKMKQEYLARRPEIAREREESLADLKEMMLSPQIDPARLNARVEKIQAHTDDLIRFAADKFVELHDLLTPDQRNRLVEELQKHEKRRRHW